MTVHRIIRWVVPVDDQPHAFPLSGAIVHVASRSPVGTGQPFPREWKHVGTALAADGAALVWHLMERA